MLWIASNGQTFMALLKQQRLQGARALVMASCRPLAVRSTDHFTRLFRERYGVAPNSFSAVR